MVCGLPELVLLRTTTRRRAVRRCCLLFCDKRKRNEDELLGSRDEKFGCARVCMGHETDPGGARGRGSPPFRVIIVKFAEISGGFDAVVECLPGRFVTAMTWKCHRPPGRGSCHRAAVLARS